MNLGIFEAILGTPGIQPGAVGSRSGNASHCAMPPILCFDIAQQHLVRLRHQGWPQAQQRRPGAPWGRPRRRGAGSCCSCCCGETAGSPSRPWKVRRPTLRPSATLVFHVFLILPIFMAVFLFWINIYFVKKLGIFLIGSSITSKLIYIDWIRSISR